MQSVLVVFMSLVFTFVAVVVSVESYQPSQLLLRRNRQHESYFPSQAKRIEPCTARKKFRLLAHSDPFSQNDEERLSLSTAESQMKGSLNFQTVSKYLLPVAILGVVGLVTVLSSRLDISQLLQNSVDRIEKLGPYGYLYFALVYIAAEMLAIPVFPLTASSGYLFGLWPGILLVVTSATTAAALSFLLGRTFLKEWAQQFIQKYEIWRLADKAIAKEGFKFVLLLRLSPLLPFAIANYLYAVTSVDFWSFVAATFLGFIPGSFGFVYFGNAGKELFSESGSAMPWYAYAGIGLLALAVAKSFASIAMNAVDEVRKEEEREAAAATSSEKSKSQGKR